MNDDIQKAQRLIQALAHQRMEALDKCAHYMALVQERDEEIARLKQLMNGEDNATRQ